MYSYNLNFCLNLSTEIIPNKTTLYNRNIRKYILMMKFVGVSSHIKLPFLTLGNVWHFYKNTSFASHFYKEGILLFQKFIKW